MIVGRHIKNRLLFFSFVKPPPLTMPCLQPCAIILLGLLFFFLAAWWAATAWRRGFALAAEGCAIGAFAQGMNTYASEGLAYASKNPTLAAQIQQANAARSAVNTASRRATEGLVYRVENPGKPSTEEHFSFDFIVPPIPSPALQKATPTSPFVGSL